ncbi:hypothetical protein NZJ93_11195 [Desulfofundulus thermocisternus]|nr:hypothetical protein [Desulfofundulus thermocisternus]
MEGSGNASRGPVRMPGTTYHSLMKSNQAGARPRAVLTGQGSREESMDIDLPILSGTG